MDLLKTILVYMSMVVAASVQNAPDPGAMPAYDEPTPTPYVQAAPTATPTATATPRPTPVDVYKRQMYNRAFPVGNALFFFAGEMSLFRLPCGKFSLPFFAVPAGKDGRVERPCQTFDDVIGVRGSVCGLFLFIQTHAPLTIRRQLNVIVPDASFLYESRKFYLLRHHSRHCD